MSEERFLWNKDRTEMVRVGAIRQIAIAEIGGTHGEAPPERGAKKKPPSADRSTWVIRVYFVHGAETMVLGIFDSLDEARRFAEELQRHAEGTASRAPVIQQGNDAFVA